MSNRLLQPLTFWGMSARNLYRQPLRAALTVVGVSIGIIAMTAFSALIRGMWNSTQSAITAGGTDLLVFQAGVAGDLFSVLDEETIRRKLKAIPEVQDVAAAMTHVMPVEGHPFFAVFGVRSQEYSAQANFIYEGRQIEGPDEVLLGKLAQRVLKKKIGDALPLAGRLYRIVGFFETDVIYYNGAIVMDLSSLQKLTRRDGQATAFQVKLRPGNKPVEISWKIETAIPEVVAIAMAREYQKINSGVSVVDTLQIAVALLATVIGAVIILNTMWMSVHERTREIGVLRAVGWSRRRVMGMILAESAVIGLAACCVGGPAGFGLANIATIWSMTNRFVQPVYEWSSLGAAFCVGVVLSLLGGLAPGWRASRISPAEALRYE